MTRSTMNNSSDEEIPTDKMIKYPGDQQRKIVINAEGHVVDTDLSVRQLHTSWHPTSSFFRPLPG